MSTYLSVTCTPDLDDLSVGFGKKGALHVRTGGFQSLSLLFEDGEADFDLWVAAVRRQIRAARKRDCTGTPYFVNPDAADEGTDFHHDGPCPVHPAAVA